jgi:ribosomal protein S18 acetylase RimI-like enzyme
MTVDPGITIREATGHDAEAVLRLRFQLDGETPFMMYEPGERTASVDDQRRELAALAARDNATLLVADAGSKLAGLLEIDGGTFRRNRHLATIVVGVLREFAGQGIGTNLFNEAELWAIKAGIHRLELTVMTHNAAAVALYTRRGFQIEGTRQHSLLVDGEYVDEYLMARLL